MDESAQKLAQAAQTDAWDSFGETNGRYTVDIAIEKNYRSIFICIIFLKYNILCLRGEKWASVSPSCEPFKLQQLS